MTRFSASGLGCRRGQRLVFEGLGFALGPGEALTLRGPNGSGKSTLLRCLAGLLRPAAGAVAWEGRPVADEPEAHRRRLHYVGHQDAVKPPLTVGENLAFWARLHGGHAVAAALAAFGLADLAGYPARLLSAGQRRRLALARLLAWPAPLWLLDEPTAGLDAESVGRFAAAAAEHRAAGGILLLATHDDSPLPGAGRLSLADFAPAETVAPC